MSYVRQIEPPVSLIVRPSDWDDVFSDIARVHGDHRPGIKAGHILTLEYEGKFVPLVARGSHGNERGVIALDLETRERLGDLALNKSYNFKIHSATWAECIKWAWTATDPTYRIASKLSIVSFILGIIGLFLGLLSFVPR